MNASSFRLKTNQQTFQQTFESERQNLENPPKGGDCLSQRGWLAESESSAWLAKEGQSSTNLARRLLILSLSIAVFGRAVK
mgnify:CR=1 FL=1